MSLFNFQDKYIYVLEGFQRGLTSFGQNIVRYNLDAEEWENVKMLHSLRVAPSCCILGDNFYIIGNKD